MKKRWKIGIIVLTAVLVSFLASFVGLCIYASDYRTLEDGYEYIFEEDTVHTMDGMIYFEADSDIGLVFYPGGRVEFME